MTSYRQIKDSTEFMQLMRELYFRGNKKIEEINVPKMKFLVVTGRGSPESENFVNAIQALYGIAFGLKMGFKFNKLPKPDDWFDFKVPPLEGLWWQKGQTDANDKDGWKWQLMIMLPAFINQELFRQAVADARSKHPEIQYSDIVLKEFDEGQVIQLIHVGPYSEEPRTIARLRNYAKDYGYHIRGKHHEIYMSDPRRTQPEKLKTVLRYAVSS